MARETRIEDVVAGAARLFAREGFDGASMREIAKESGVSKPGLYYHFADKDALLFHICRDSIARVLDACSRAAAVAETPEHRLRAVIAEHFAFFLAHPDHLVVLNRERRRLGEAHRVEIGGLERHYLDLIRGILRDGRDAGRFRVLNPTVAAFTVLSVLNGLDAWYHADGPLAPEDVRAQITIHLIDGLTAKTGDPP